MVHSLTFLHQKTAGFVWFLLRPKRYSSEYQSCPVSSQRSVVFLKLCQAYNLWHPAVDVWEVERPEVKALNPALRAVMPVDINEYWGFSAVLSWQHHSQRPTLSNFILVLLMSQAWNLDRNCCCYFINYIFQRRFLFLIYLIFMSVFSVASANLSHNWFQMVF